MKQVLAITRKELDSYFGSPMALIFVGLFLVTVLFSFFWVSGFFGSGKSLLMKTLGVLLTGGEIDGQPVHGLFLNRLLGSSPDRVILAVDVEECARADDEVRRLGAPGDCDKPPGRVSIWGEPDGHQPKLTIQAQWISPSPRSRRCCAGPRASSWPS